MRYKTMLLLPALGALSLFGLSFGSSSKGYTSITPEEAKKIMDSQPCTIVDVRRPEEYETGHIPQAQLLPLESIGEEMPALLPDKEATILLYCRSGIRSKEAATKLSALGYTHIREFGGILEWPYEIKIE